MADRRKYLAEALGTFAIVFCGTGAVVIDGETGGAVTHVGVAATFGLIVMAMIFTFGDSSGAHFNPAVSIAFTAARRFPSKQLIPYIASQLSGAALASTTLKLLFPANQNLGATVPANGAAQSFILELLLTFLLLLVILKVASGGKEQGLSAALLIGAVVGLEALFAGPISGASMNPARSIAPALLSGQVGFVWLYTLAPITGALLAVYCWRYLAG